MKRTLAKALADELKHYFGGRTFTEAQMLSATDNDPYIEWLCAALSILGEVETDEETRG